MDYVDLFEHIFGGNKGYICLAFKQNMDDKLEQSFFLWKEEIDKIETWVEEHKSGNCYFCPALLSEPIRRKQYTLTGHTLYADLDQCEPGLLGKYGEPEPSVVVQTSPNRWQAYWLLDRNIEPEEYEALNHRIAIGYKDEGCDQSGWDLTQLLRIPSTINNKDKPFEVRAKGWFAIHPSKENPAKFDDLPPLPSTPTPHRVETIRRDVPPVEIKDLRIPDSVKEYLINPPSKGERSEAAWAVMLAMRDAGYSREQVYATMWANPLGRRYSAYQLKQDVGRAFSKEMALPQGSEYRVPTLTQLKARAGEVSNLIPNMLSRGEIVLWYGSPKSGKTMQCQDMAASLIVGEPIFGIFPVEKPLRVIYLSYEMSAQELIQRFEIRTKGRGLENLRLDRYRGAKFPDREIMKTIRSGTKNFRPDVVFHDPLINMHSLDENSSRDMHSVIDPIRDDAEAKGYGVILIHHTGVQKQDELTGRLLKARPRGSSAIEGCADLTIAVKQTLQKHVRIIETDLIRSIGVRDWKHKIVFDPVTLKITPVIEGNAYDEVIENIITEAGGSISKKELADKISERLSMARSQRYKIIDRAEEEGKVEVRGEGKGQIVFLPQEGNEGLDISAPVE